MASCRAVLASASACAIRALAWARRAGLSPCSMRHRTSPASTPASLWNRFAGYQPRCLRLYINPSRCLREAAKRKIVDQFTALALEDGHFGERSRFLRGRARRLRGGAKGTRRIRRASSGGGSLLWSRSLPRSGKDPQADPGGDRDAEQQIEYASNPTLVSSKETFSAHGSFCFSLPFNCRHIPDCKTLVLSYSFGVELTGPVRGAPPAEIVPCVTAEVRATFGSDTPLPPGHSAGSPRRSRIPCRVTPASRSAAMLASSSRFARRLPFRSRISRWCR